MDYIMLKKAIAQIREDIENNKDYLIELDQVSGDGDLGIYMTAGFQAIEKYVNSSEERDLGLLMRACGSEMNEAAPSSLGTILSFGFMGMAKALKGKETASFEEFVNAYESGIQMIMKRAESKPGQKTILDALYPALEAYKANLDDAGQALKAGAEAAAKGSDATREMAAVHGRAARYGEKSIGWLDGGSVVGKLIVGGIAKAI